MTINCVVVTYNRLNLLKECLNALEHQTYPIHRIIVIDNCSTDGTASFLESKSQDKKYIIIRTETNIGGAGGFSLGLKESVSKGCDYTWMMDDDTIPSITALDELVKVIDKNMNIGFVCSKVNWIDGTLHIMNQVALLKEKGMPQTQVKKVNVWRCSACSFVSVLINSKAVYHLGLPIKEFFIWCDDLEYTLRISNAGYACFYAEDSIVCHKTTSNYAPSIKNVPEDMAWRFYYQARNRCYMKHTKIKNRLLFYLSVLNMYRVYLHRIRKRDKKSQKAFLKAVKKGCVEGLTFRPKIDFIK